MTKQERVAEAIKQVITTMMDRVMVRVLIEDPFLKDEHHYNKPLYAALVPDEIFKGSHFERRFVTPFGKVWENLAKVVATEAHGHCEVGHTITGNVGMGRLRRIQEVLNRMYSKNYEFDWDKEIKYILAGRGQLLPVTIKCDIFINNEQTEETYIFELEKSESDRYEIRASIEKIFKLLAMTPPQVTSAYYALPYNPYGKKENYKWVFPMRWFNMHTDESVLIGDEFWDLIGGTGTYANFIKEINLLGKEYHERIYREFLDIEPPKKSEENVLK